MAKQLLGKEVTAALNEKIKANVAELEAKGVNQPSESSVSERERMIFPTKEEQPNAARP